MWPLRLHCSSVSWTDHNTHRPCAHLLRVLSLLLQLVQANRSVVAAVRDPAKAEDVFQSISGDVAIEPADVTDTSSFTEDLWRGVTQVVSAVGPTFQRTEEGPK